MVGSNVFAVLIPFDQMKLARNAFRLPENANWYCNSAEGIAEKPTVGSREPTPTPLSPFEVNYNFADCTLLRLD